MLNATLNHEMMQPLTCIIFFATALLAKGLQQEDKKKLNMIVSSAKLLRCQMKDMLDRNLIENGQLTPSFEHRSV